MPVCARHESRGHLGKAAPAERARRARGTRTAVAVAAVVSCAAVGTALAASTNFKEARSSPEALGGSPRGVVTADFDGDTDVDLAVANLPSSVNILRNNGSGNFRQPASETVGSGGASLVAADFDGDTDPDLAVANFISDNVTILRNNGTGNFYQPNSSPVATGDTPVSIAATDLDGDTDLDLATANLDSNDVTILRNNGSGKFSQPGSSPEMVGANPAAVAAADLDGDDDQDLAVALGSPLVAILLNDGSGDLVQPGSSPEQVGNQPVAVVAADLDGDDDADLAVANSTAASVSFLRNTGTGNFIEPGSSPEPTDTFPNALAAADFDADGDSDLAVANQLGDDVTILRNMGSGNFVEPGSSPESAIDGPISIAAADLDGDVDPDLAVVDANSANVRILRNR